MQIEDQIEQTKFGVRFLAAITLWFESLSHHQSSHGSVMVCVPVPERYAIHKLIVSQLRHKTSSKPEGDLRQAAVLIEALVERYPGAIEDAVSAVPKSAARHLARAIRALEQHLPPTAAAARDALHTIAHAE
jgi:hypothetical protein